GEGGPGLLGDLREGLRLADGEVGEDLAVEFDAGLAESVDELAVGEAELSGGCVDADNPEAAELTLAVAPPDGGVPQGVHHGLVRDLVVGPALSSMPFGEVEDLAVAVAGLDAGADAGHEGFLVLSSLRAGVLLGTTAGISRYVS